MYAMGCPANAFLQKLEKAVHLLSERVHRL